MTTERRKIIDGSEIRRRHRSCYACDAWDPGVVLEGGHYSTGLCLRHAPRLGRTVEDESEWPVTMPDDWCYEFVDRARVYDQLV